MQYADEYAAALEPVRYAKKAITADDYGPFGEGREVGNFVRRVATGRDPNATADMAGLAKAIHENGEWHKLPILADAVQDAAHPAENHFDLRNTEDAIHRLKGWTGADSTAAYGGPSDKRYAKRRQQFADALRQLGRHEEASDVADSTKHILKYHGGGGRFLPLVHPYDFDPMTRQYAETALWSSHDAVPTGPDGDHDIENLDENHTIHDLDPETSSLMAADVKHFRDTLPKHLRDAVDADPTQAGHDFWLTRNGHGAGFRDGQWGELGDVLADHTHHHFGEHSLYIDRQQDDITDDGRPTFVSTIRTNSNWRHAGGMRHPYEPLPGPHTDLF